MKLILVFFVLFPQTAWSSGLYVAVRCNQNIGESESTLFISFRAGDQSGMEIKHIKDQGDSYCELTNKHAGFQELTNENVDLELCLGYDASSGLGKKYTLHLRLDAEHHEEMNFEAYDSLEACIKSSRLSAVESEKRSR